MPMPKKSAEDLRKNFPIRWSERERAVWKNKAAARGLADAVYLRWLVSRDRPVSLRGTVRPRKKKDGAGGESGAVQV